MENERYIGWLRKRVGSGLILSPSVGAVIRDALGRLLDPFRRGKRAHRETPDAETGGGWA